MQGKYKYLRSFSRRVKKECEVCVCEEGKFVEDEQEETSVSVSRGNILLSYLGKVRWNQTAQGETSVSVSRE